MPIIFFGINFYQKTSLLIFVRMILDRVFLKLHKTLLRESKKFGFYSFFSKIKAYSMEDSLYKDIKYKGYYSIKLKTINLPNSNNLEGIFKVKELYALYSDKKIVLSDYFFVDSDLLEISNLYLRIYLLNFLESEINGKRVIEEINNLFRSSYHFKALSSNEVVNLYKTPGSFINSNSFPLNQKTYLFLRAIDRLGLRKYYKRLVDFEFYLFEKSNELYKEIYRDVYELYNIPRKISLDSKIKDFLERIDYKYYSDLAKLYDKTLNPFKRLRIIMEKEILESLFNLRVSEIRKMKLESLIGPDFYDRIRYFLYFLNKKGKKELKNLRLRDLIDQINKKHLQYYLDYYLKKNDAQKDLY